VYQAKFEKPGVRSAARPQAKQTGENIRLYRYTKVWVFITSDIRTYFSSVAPNHCMGRDVNAVQWVALCWAGYSNWRISGTMVSLMGLSVRSVLKLRSSVPVPNGSICSQSHFLS
jgi:hypothetical protein